MGCGGSREQGPSERYSPAARGPRASSVSPVSSPAKAVSFLDDVDDSPDYSIHRHLPTLRELEVDVGGGNGAKEKGHPVMHLLRRCEAAGETIGRLYLKQGCLWGGLEEEDDSCDDDDDDDAIGCNNNHYHSGTRPLGEAARAEAELRKISVELSVSLPDAPGGVQRYFVRYCLAVASVAKATCAYSPVGRAPHPAQYGNAFSQLLYALHGENEAGAMRSSPSSKDMVRARSKSNDSTLPSSPSNTAAVPAPPSKTAAGAELARLRDSLWSEWRQGFNHGQRGVAEAITERPLKSSGGPGSEHGDGGVADIVVGKFRGRVAGTGSGNIGGPVLRPYLRQPVPRSLGYVGHDLEETMVGTFYSGDEGLGDYDGERYFRDTLLPAALAAQPLLHTVCRNALLVGARVGHAEMFMAPLKTASACRQRAGVNFSAATARAVAAAAAAAAAVAAAAAAAATAAASSSAAGANTEVSGSRVQYPPHFYHEYPRQASNCDVVRAMLIVDDPKAVAGVVDAICKGHNGGGSSGSGGSGGTDVPCYRVRCIRNYFRPPSDHDSGDDGNGSSDRNVQAKRKAAAKATMQVKGAPGGIGRNTSAAGGGGPASSSALKEAGAEMPQTVVRPDLPCICIYLELFPHDEEDEAGHIVEVKITLMRLVGIFRQMKKHRTVLSAAGSIALRDAVSDHSLQLNSDDGTDRANRVRLNQGDGSIGFSWHAWQERMKK